MLLDDGQDGGGGQDEAQDHVECDEELVELALAHDVAGVVAVGEDDADHGDQVEDSSYREKGIEPVLAVIAAVIILPRLGPRMSKVDDEHELDDDEHESPDHAKVHPGWAEVSMWDEEGADAAGDDEEVLEAPEAILDSGARVSGVPDAHHDKTHEEEEEGDDETDPIDSKVANCILTLDTLWKMLDANTISNALKIDDNILKEKLAT